MLLPVVSAMLPTAGSAKHQELVKFALLAITKIPRGTLFALLARQGRIPPLLDPGTLIA